MDEAENVERSDCREIAHLPNEASKVPAVRFDRAETAGASPLLE
jgi:hypothetical protein